MTCTVWNGARNLFPGRLVWVSLFALARPSAIAALGHRGRKGHPLDADGRKAVGPPKDPFRMAQFLRQAECVLDTIQDHREQVCSQNALLIVLWY